MKISIKILGNPTAKQSFRFSVIAGHVHKYQSSKVKNESNNMRAQIVDQLPDGWQPLDGPLAVSGMVFVFPWLSSHSKKKRALGGCFWRDTKPDIDNLMKAVLDASQGILFNKDSQIACLESVSKVYGDVPRIEFTLVKI